jgi:voltage-gated potassium channel
MDNPSNGARPPTLGSVFRIESWRRDNLRDISLRKHRLPRIGRQGFIYSLVIAILILFLGGLGFVWLEPRVHSLADGLWLAFTTAATVGYGDIVPSTLPSKAFSVLVVLLGLAVLSLITASLASMFVERDVEQEEHAIERKLIHEIRLVRDEVAAMREQLRMFQSSTGTLNSEKRTKPPAPASG